jgi:DNA-binding FadR family transcriptional regulator
MSTDLSPITRRSLAARVADQIRRRITTGDLPRGRRIEPSRVLSEQLEVSLPVLREALAALSYLGMIEVRHGVGTFVSWRRPGAHSLKVAHRRGSAAELHQLRATIAAEMAARAAQRKRTERQQLDLHMLLQERRLAMLAGEPRGFVQADLDLHAFVAGSAGSALHAALDRMTGIGLFADMTGHARWLALDGDLDALHETLVDAIDARDADAARAAAIAIAVAEGAAPD